MHAHIIIPHILIPWNAKTVTSHINTIFAHDHKGLMAFAICQNYHINHNINNI